MQPAVKIPLQVDGTLKLNLTIGGVGLAAVEVPVTLDGNHLITHGILADPIVLSGPQRVAPPGDLDLAFSWWLDYDNGGTEKRLAKELFVDGFVLGLRHFRDKKEAVGKQPSRWVPLTVTSTSGKRQFVCTICGRVSPTPDKECPGTLSCGEATSTCSSVERDGMPDGWVAGPIVLKRYV